MKNALKMMLSYLMFLIIGTVVGIIIIVEFLATVGLIAGRTQPLFASEIFVRAFFIVAPVIIVGSCTFLALYAVRHHVKKVASALTYTFLCLLTWLVLFPAFLVFAERSSFLAQFETVESLAEINDAPLSKNYFRKAGNFIYYITDETAKQSKQTTINAVTGLKEEKSDSVVIFTEGIDPESMMFEVSSVSDTLKEQAEPFTDTLIRDTMSYELLPVFYRSFDLLMATAKNAWDAGVINWIFFASLGCALCSVYAFIGLSRWRIINTLAVVLMTACIFICNYLYFAGFIPIINIPLGGIFSKIDNLFLELINFCISIVFILIGVIVSIVRSARKGYRG